MRNYVLLSVGMFLIFQVQIALSQDHTFKIVGDTKVTDSSGYKTVEYDPASTNHLFISYFNIKGAISARRQFLFTGKKFNLAIDHVHYLDRKEIIIDGVHTFFNPDGSVSESFEYKNGTLLFTYSYHSNGQKRAQIPGLPELLNGEYKMWFPNGQLSFGGTYKNNVKSGNFEQFDEFGSLLKKGFYQDGKLISGEPVILDVIYKKPEVPAKYTNGTETIDEFLKRKSGQIELLKDLPEEETIVLLISVDKIGKITNLDTPGTITPLIFEILKLLLEPLPAFSSARVENIPVDSQLTLELIVSNKEIKMASEKMAPYSIVEEMPEFSGGSVGLKRFLATTVEYPIEALEKGKQGKVLVNFIIEEDGSISSVNVARSVYPLLDAEAIRVVKAMPKWTPGRQSGKTVRVKFTVPINFATQ